MTHSEEIDIELIDLTLKIDIINVSNLEGKVFSLIVVG